MIKVLIVDDERNIREGITHLIDWASLGCEVAGSVMNGVTALEFIAGNHPDIVVTDIKMPQMDGLELAKCIHEQYPDTKVIILTAYSEFEMAKLAIKYKVTDFIVKNDFMDELPKAVERNVALIKEKRKDAEPAYDETEDDAYFMGLFKSLVANSELSEAEAKKFSGCNFCICACEISRYEEGSDSERNLYDMFNNILKVGLKNCRFTTIPVSEKLLAIGIVYDKASGMNLNRIVEYLSNILIMVEEFMRIEIKIGVSTQLPDVLSIKPGFSEAKQALSKIDAEGCSLKVYDGNVKQENGDLIDVNGYSENICALTFDEKKNGAVEVLLEFTDKLRQAGCSFEQCKLYMLVIYSTILHRAVRYQLNVDMDFNTYERELYLRVQDANTILGLYEIGKEMILKVRSICIGQKNFRNELVKKVDDCIKANYRDELTLQVISNEIFLNASYVSRAYKKMTGNTVTEAITLYRVSKAKELLRTTNLKIYEIAENVGFKDAAYFTNVFYKYTNTNPSDYRQKL